MVISPACPGLLLYRGKVRRQLRQGHAEAGESLPVRQGTVVCEAQDGDAGLHGRLDIVRLGAAGVAAPLGVGCLTVAEYRTSLQTNCEYIVILLVKALRIWYHIAMFNP